MSLAATPAGGGRERRQKVTGMLASFLDDANQVTIIPTSGGTRLPAIKSSMGSPARSPIASAMCGKRIGFGLGVKAAPLDEIDIPEGIELGISKVISVRGEDITPAFWREGGPKRSRKQPIKSFQRITIDEQRGLRFGTAKYMALYSEGNMSRRVSTARGVTFGEATERTYERGSEKTPHSARSHVSQQSQGSVGVIKPAPVLRKPIKDIKEHTGETPPATPKTWRLESRGNPYLKRPGLEADDDDDDDNYGLIDPHAVYPTRQRGGGMVSHQVTGEEVAEVRGVMGSVRRTLHVKRQQQKDEMAARKAEMVAARLREAEEGKMVIARAREGMRQSKEAEGRTRVIRNHVTKMANEEFVSQARADVDDVRDSRADEWRGKREKGKTIIERTREAESDYFRMIQQERGIVPLKRKLQPAFLKPPLQQSPQEVHGILKILDAATKRA